MKNFYGGEKGFAPFERLPNTNYYHYVVQLNMYKYMLETFYKYTEVDGVVFKHIVVDKMFIVCCNPGFDDYQQYMIPPLDKKQMEEVFRDRELALSKELNISLPTEDVPKQ